MATPADVVVVGLGAAGAATTLRLARRGVRVIALDRHHPPHDRGSSHGGSRITRQAVGEGDELVPLALRSHQLWRELEHESGESLMLATGALIIGRPDEGGVHTGKRDFVRRTIEAARRFAIPHEVLSPDEASSRFPMFRLDEGETAYFEPGGGVLLPERCVAVQIDLARRHGAEIRLGETVLELQDEGSAVRVVTHHGEYSAGQVVVAAGAWAGGLLQGRIAARFSTYRQIMHWFAPVDAAAFAPSRMPVFIWMHGAVAEQWFYGFPILPGEAGVKIADERFDSPLASPDAQTQIIDPAESGVMWARHVAGRMTGVTDRCVKSTACLYTMAPESRFQIGRDPERERVIVVSACSGHGFKHSAAIGELVADLAGGAASPLLAPFSLYESAFR